MYHHPSSSLKLTNHHTIHYPNAKTKYQKKTQDCADHNPLIRALAIRTMSYIPLPIVTEALTEPLRHALKDRDPYVRKTAAICVAKVYTADPRRTEKHGFVEMLRDLMLDNNATVVANAVASLVEISERHDGVAFKVNYTVANKLLTALAESSEYVSLLFFFIVSYDSRWNVC